MIYKGFDRTGYPGDAIMKSVRDNTELRWCGFYLGPGFDWSPHFPQIQDMGWGVAPVYGVRSGAKVQAIVSRHSGDPKAKESALWDSGTLDGQQAVDQARAAHIPLGTILYFDVEDPDQKQNLNWLEYYRGWSRGVADRYYDVGLYTRKNHAAWLMGKLRGDGLSRPFDIVMPTIWIAQYSRSNPNGVRVPDADFLSDPLPTPPDPKTVYSEAAMWQHMGNLGLKWTDSGKTRKLEGVDYDSSIYPDPGTGFLSTI